MKLTNIEICEKYDLPVTLSTNVAEEYLSKNKVKAIMKIIANTLATTLGPHGKSVVCQGQNGKHLITKDGYDVINRMSFTDDIANTVLGLIREVSAAQVSKVGDGSTSAIIVSEALHNKLADLTGISQKDIIDILKEFESMIEEEVMKVTQPVKSMDTIEHVAAVSLNNDTASGKLIRDIYDVVGPEGFINTDYEQPCKEDFVEYKKGIEFYRGYTDKCYAKSNGKVIYEADNGTAPVVFILNCKIDYDHVKPIIAPILSKYCGEMERQVLIILNEFTPDVYTVFKNNRIQHLIRKGNREFDFTVVDIDNVTDKSIHDIHDIGLLCGCKVYDPMDCYPENFIDHIAEYAGIADKIVVTDTSTQIIAADLPAEKQQVIDDFVAELKETYNKKDRGEELIDPREAIEIRRRIANLTCGTSIIHIAGESLSERASRERLFEDAILSARSALKEGIVPGGNLIIPYVLTDKMIMHMSDLISKKMHWVTYERIYDLGQKLRDAIQESFLNVLLNAEIDEVEANKIVSRCLKRGEIYNLKTRKYEKFTETNIINSVKTDLQILRSVVSLVAILSTSTQYLTLHQETDSITKHVLDKQNKENK